MPLYPAGISTVMKMQSVSNSSPTEGDFWYDSTQKVLYAHINGMTQSFGTRLFMGTTDQTVTNTTTETTALSTGVGTKTLPANFLVAGKTIHIRGGGVFSTATIAPGTLTVKVKLGSTVIASSTAFSPVANLSQQGFDFDVSLTCRTTGASGTVVITGGFNYSTGLNLARNFNDLVNSGSTVTVDTTASQAIDVTCTWGTASASNIVKTTTCVISAER